MLSANRIASLIGLIAIISLPLAVAQPASGSTCKPEALKRPLANTFFDRKDYLGAIELLQSVIDRQTACDSLVSDEAKARSSDWYWLRSDLALAYLRAGRETDCRDLLTPLIGDPRHPDYLSLHQDSNPHLARALETNLRLCSEAHEKRFADYRAESCPWPIHEALIAIQIDAKRCLALMPRQEQGTCPTLVEVRPGAQHAIPLIDDAGATPLGDPSRCCSIQKLSIKQQNGDYRIRLNGEGRDCFGGSAYDLIDSLYLWHEQQLRPLGDYSRSM